ncbi:hypothetical protein [Mesorhizobium sp. BR-1-1-10]|uniref:hypothetical protein n=1 Tax=Mesorhizobium sp. BR-1-1-10 TaxID=2876660 RepID=UPI001CD08CD6|nr:hypothetical protein [Mesorhizobium sp. BR-1-1-10]MBZ9975501.1 hypothetical protein [Mesorhizobium sp. BR-1-1-10]
MNLRQLLALPGHMLGKRPLPPTESQMGVQARVIAHLEKYGVIDALTAQRMGTTDPRKMFTRLRRQGYLYRADNPRGHFNVPNHSGRGDHRVHYWTGKRPGERRAVKRGGVK